MRHSVNERVCHRTRFGAKSEEGVLVAPRGATVRAMRTAVVRVVIDRSGQLSVDAYQRGVERLRGAGLTVIATPAAFLPERNREIEIIVESDGPVVPTAVDSMPSAEQGAPPGGWVDRCTEAFGLQAHPGVVTYISRGTDDDVLGVLAAFHAPCVASPRVVCTRHSSRPSTVRCGSWRKRPVTP